MANIPDDLERRIAESLRNRADDVTPSPELWARVESTVNRPSRRTWGLAIAGAALVAAAAVVVIPQLINEEGVVVEEPPSETPTTVPTDAPTEEPTNNTDDPTGVPGTPADQAILATDGEDLFIVGLDGARGDMLFEGNRQDERSLVSFSIRPGGSVADFDAIVLFGGEGGSRFFHLRVRGGEPTMTELADQYQPNARFLEVPTRPAFSPDGHHVAWVEMPDDEQAEGPTLRTIGWTDDGPGTGRTADDNASFTLTELPLQAYRVEDWVWEIPHESGDLPGHLVLRAATNTIETVLVPIARQGDNALILPSGGTTLVDGVVVDRAESGGIDLMRVHELVVGSDGTQDAEGVVWTLEIEDDNGSREVELPLGPTADPGIGWLDAVDDLVLAGHGGTAVLVENGQATIVDAEIQFGALLPPVD